jgi:CheY-like chemotaxis protein
MPAGTRNRVLVVDDERKIADTLALILNANGYDAHAAYGGEEAIELAASLKPDILISDVVMAGMSGIEVAIYFANYLPACRIVLISGNVLSASLLELAGKDGYQFQLLPKPVHPQILMSHLSAARESKTSAEGRQKSGRAQAGKSQVD